MLRHFSAALQVLRHGGTVAYPTEAVYGYGCNPYNPYAVAQLLAIKNRVTGKGLILVASDIGQISELLAPLTRKQRRLVLDSWPGPVTWLIPDSANQIPVWIKGTHTAVAVRVTDHPVASALCSRWGGPLVSTSANFSGQEPAATELQLRRRARSMPQRLKGLDYIIPGRVGGLARPTEIRDLESGKIFRSG